MEEMIAAVVVCAPRLGYQFLFIALFIAAYPLWHADFPTIRTLPEVEIPPMDLEAPVPAHSGLFF
jgi:hypothetical protein